MLATRARAARGADRYMPPDIVSIRAASDTYDTVVLDTCAILNPATHYIGTQNMPPNAYHKHIRGVVLCIGDNPRILVTRGVRNEVRNLAPQDPYRLQSGDLTATLAALSRKILRDPKDGEDFRRLRDEFLREFGAPFEAKYGLSEIDLEMLAAVMVTSYLQGDDPPKVALFTNDAGLLMAHADLEHALCARGSKTFGGIVPAVNALTVLGSADYRPPDRDFWMGRHERYMAGLAWDNDVNRARRRLPLPTA